MAAVPPNTLVDGVVWGDEHPVRWKSMPEYLNFGFDQKQAFEEKCDPAEHDASGGVRKNGGGGGGSSRSGGVTPPRVSVTLSDFLAREETSGSCDFGWFTHSGSMGSIDDLATMAEGGTPRGSLTFPSGLESLGLAATPAYLRNHQTPMAPNSEHSSTANTAALSPLSAVERLACASPSREDLNNNNNGHLTNSVATRAAGNSRVAVYSNGTTVGNASARASATNVGSAGADNNHCPSPAARAVRRTHIRSRAANRMPEINQWHTIHRYASSKGALAAESEGGGMCAMHLRRSSFPLSTRHFPEHESKEPVLMRSSSDRSGRASGAAAGSPAGRTCGGGHGRGGGRGAVMLNGGSPALRNRPARFAQESEAMDGGWEVRGRGAGLGMGMAGGRAGGGEEPQLRKVEPKSYAWALTEIRVVKGGSPWAQPRAEYLVVACLGQGKLVAGWRRATDFARLASVARRFWMSKVRW